MYNDQGGPQPQGADSMKIQNATEQGWLEAEPGDGIVLNFLGRARGRVQKNRSPTLHTDGGGSTGVTIMADSKPTIRKLTEKECLKLQGFTDEEADRLRNATRDGKRLFPKTALYRFAGNAVCVACFERITEQILDDMDGLNNQARGIKRSTLDAWMGGTD